MNISLLIFRYLQFKPLSTFLNIILFTFGISIITVLLLFSSQMEKRLTDSSRGIDLVVGAKGSPLQLILCNIFHVDFPYTLQGGEHHIHSKKFGRFLRTSIERRFLFVPFQF